MLFVTQAIAQPIRASGGLGTSERYLSLWVALCMLAGIALGKLAPSAVAGLRGIEVGQGSQINAPIAVLIWLMITPMMTKVDFSSVKNVGKRPAGLLVTLFINWVVKPFSMALLAWAFFRVAFCSLHHFSRGRSVHCGLHHSGGCPLHGYGFRLEPHHQGGLSLYACAGVGE
jgi:Sodium Bile acid symporter family